MFYDDKTTVPKLVIRYAIGTSEREAIVLANGHSLEEHVDRLEALAESPGSSDTYVPWPLASGGAIAIRLGAIVAVEAREWVV